MADTRTALPSANIKAWRRNIGWSLNFPPRFQADRPVLIVGHGWIYPTDSSINVAISQGGRAKPYGLVLEQKNPAGVWEPLRDNLGFPAGKNKDIVIELPAQSLAVSRRISAANEYGGLLGFPGLELSP